MTVELAEAPLIRGNSIDANATSIKGIRIFTHAGGAHRDEFISCCLLLATYPVEGIYRCRDIIKTSDGQYIAIIENELIPINVGLDIVVDIGGEYSPSKKLYDHHQDLNLPSSLLMILQHELFYDTSNLPKEIMFIDYADKHGFLEAKRVLKADVGPAFVDSAILSVFSIRNIVTRGDPLYEVMREMGIVFQAKLDSYADTSYIAIIEYGQPIPLGQDEGPSIVFVDVTKLIPNPQTRYFVVFRLRNDRVDITTLKVISSGQYNGYLIGLVGRNKRAADMTEVVSIDNNELFRPTKIKSYKKVFEHPNGFIAVIAAEFDYIAQNYEQLIQECLNVTTQPSG